VATPIAIEGTGAHDGRECLVASDPAGFAARVAQVYTDCALWGRLAEAGYRNVQRHFSREMGRPALLQVRLVAGWPESNWACAGLPVVVKRAGIETAEAGECHVGCPWQTVACVWPGMCPACTPHEACHPLQPAKLASGCTRCCLLMVCSLSVIKFGLWYPSQALNQIGVGPLHDYHRDQCQPQGRRPGSSSRS